MKMETNSKLLMMMIYCPLHSLCFFKYSKHGEPFRLIIHYQGTPSPTITGNCQDEIQCSGCQVEYRLIRRVNGPRVIFIIQNYFLITS